MNVTENNYEKNSLNDKEAGHLKPITFKTIPMDSLPSHAQIDSLVFRYSIQCARMSLFATVIIGSENSNSVSFSSSSSSSLLSLCSFRFILDEKFESNLLHVVYIVSIFTHSISFWLIFFSCFYFSLLNIYGDIYELTDSIHAFLSSFVEVTNALHTTSCEVFRRAYCLAIIVDFSGKEREEIRAIEIERPKKNTTLKSHWKLCFYLVDRFQLEQRKINFDLI